MMDYTKSLSYLHALNMNFWKKCQNAWAELKAESKKKWLDKAVELTLAAWVKATEGTNLKPPQSLNDFAFKGLPFDLDGDGKPDNVSYYSSKQYYGTLPKECKPNWNAMVVKQLCEQLKDEYELKEGL